MIRTWTKRFWMAADSSRKNPAKYCRDCARFGRTLLWIF